jgi:hypothetical protein
MPKPALSLFGFLEKGKAFEYLRQQTCMVNDSSSRALQEQFEDAQSRLRTAIEKAGYPEMLGIPIAHQQYVEAVKNSPSAKALEGRETVTIQLVEIAPLLATQIHIELDRAEGFYQRNKTLPDIGEMLLTCLPLQGAENFPIEVSRSLLPNSNNWIVRTPSLNFRPLEGGLIAANGEHYLGVKVGLANPLVQVLKFEGRSYLANGFHRAFVFGRAGAKHLPCIVQEVQSLNEVAFGIPPERFLLENPPTLGHFLNDHAYPVQMRNYKKYMAFTFAEHIFFEE